MVEFDRVKSQCRADIDNNLLRGVQADYSRLHSRLKLLEGEIEGAQKVIAEKQQQIEAARHRADDLRRRLEYLSGQARELTDDTTRWQTHQAG